MRIKLIGYFKSQLNHNGFLFLQERHSTIENEDTWVNNFNGRVFFSHGVSKSFGVLNKQKTDKTGGILVLDVILETFLRSFKTCQRFLISIKNKQIIIPGDFNISFNSKLEAKGGNPLPKRKSISKLVDIKESLDICDIWRIINPRCQNVIFRQNHSNGFIERRLDYIFTSNCFQEFVNYTAALPALSTDYSPVLISLSNDNSDNNGCSLWNINSSLVHDVVYVENMKKLNTKINTSNDFFGDALKEIL